MLVRGTCTTPRTEASVPVLPHAHGLVGNRTGCSTQGPGENIEAVSAGPSSKLLGCAGRSD
jgi:hypothetical protein